MYVIEDMRLTESGALVSDGFYGGRHEKYYDMILINAFPENAYGFETAEAAKETAVFYNARGYNFIVRNRRQRQKEMGRNTDKGGEQVTNLKRTREASGLSQAKLAEASGVNKRMIQHYEQGVKDINVAAALTVSKLAKVLDCTVEDLLEETN